MNKLRIRIKDEISRARKNVPCGESLKYCEECGEEIPEARRKAMPGVRLCISCQEEADKQNRRSAFTTVGAAKTASSNNCCLISEKRIILRKIFILKIIVL